MAIVKLMSDKTEEELIATLKKAQLVLVNVEMITNELAIITRKAREKFFGQAQR